LFSFLNLNFNILSSLFVFSVFFQSLLVVNFFFFFIVSVLCKNGDEEKKSLQKHFFDFEHFFYPILVFANFCIIR